MHHVLEVWPAIYIYVYTMHTYTFTHQHNMFLCTVHIIYICKFKCSRQVKHVFILQDRS